MKGVETEMDKCLCICVSISGGRKRVCLCVCVCRDGYVCLCAQVETGSHLEESHECAKQEEIWGVEGDTGLYGGVFL